MSQDEALPSTLFVFGSFSDGMVHFRKIAPYVLARRPAAIQGAVLRLPSGLVALAGEGASVIRGEVVELRSYEILLTLLDEFHGVHRADPAQSLFFRESVVAVTDSGVSEKTNVYRINSARVPRGAVELRDCDWRRELAENPPLFARLTERQKAYIQKLGSSAGRSKGREIVPIDLALYRELMHLEIVVDKGRRLALTALGQELCRLLG